MTKTPALRGILAGFVLLVGCVSPALAQGAKRITPEQMLDPRLAPKHDDVSITTPSAAELAACTIEQVLGQAKGSSGWVLLDAKKQPVRRFFDTTGRGNVDMWSYFKDGVEVYREFDTTGKGSPDNFRWLNSAGMKWGVGTVNAQGKAVIRAWNMISAEEASFEAFQAVQTNDFARFQALLVTENDLSRIKLSAAKIKTTLAIQQTAKKKFADLIKEVNLSGAKFDHVESATPHCDTHSEIETIKYASRAVRYVIGKDERKWIHTNEIVQVGPASWRLVDVPSGKESGGANIDERPMVQPVAAETQKIMDRIAEIDKLLTNNTPMPGAGNKNFHGLIQERISLVYKMIPLEKESERENWYKQLFDNLMAMTQNMCDDASLASIKKMSDDVVAQMPKSSLAPYGVYRLHWSTYTAETHVAKEDSKKIAAAQEKFLANLGDFVKKYVSAEDTPEALYQLGSGCEFSGKIEEAKRWYGELAKNFPKNHMAARADGCVRRLSLVGNTLELTAPYLADSTKTFSMAQLKGKVVIVHFWSSQSEQYDVDFRKLKLIVQASTKQNVELVCVCLDDSAAKAADAVRKTGAAGIHLFQAPNNNAANPIGVHFGIQILPTVFVVGRDGRVTNNAVQISDVETELKKVQ